MTQETLKQMYQLLLTEPHAPTVCAQLERIAREALAEHAIKETQRLGQEIEQEPVGQLLEEVYGRGQVMWFNKPKDESMLYIHPPQRTWVDLTDEEYDEIWRMDLNNKDIMDKTIAKLKEKST